VEQVDERTSSIEAAQRFAAGRAAGSRKRKGAASLDATAAVVILERWLREPQSRIALPPEPEA
jgi:putative Holliday junction resolvase